MTALVQRTVLFYDDELIAIQDPDTSAIFVPLTRLCDNLGIARARQAQRIREHPVLQRGFTTLTFESGGGPQEAQCLRIDMIPLWLSGVNANRVKPAIRDKLIRYQTEVADVLWQAFKHDILPPSQTQSMLPAESSGAAIAYEMATAIQHLARQQMELEQKLGGRMDTMARWGKQVDARLTNLELQLHPGNYIPNGQAAELSARVKALALLMTERGTKDNHYQGVFAELYRRFGVSSYKTVTREQYESVMAFLEEWRQAVLAGNLEPPAWEPPSPQGTG
jgi:hypothetical protein